MRAQKVITSKAHALAIVERVAAKHDLSVATALCVKRDRYAVACRAEIAHTLKIELGWSQRAIGGLLGVTQPGARKLLGYREISLRRANNLLPAETLHAISTINASEALRKLAEAEARAAHLQGELDRLTGASLTHKLAECFDLGSRIRCAVVLAIVAEAYPRAVNALDMVELYDDACGRLNYGFRRGASFNLITKNIAALRSRFSSLGYADPILSSEGSFGMSRRLTDKAAMLLHEMTGTPRLSQLPALKRVA